MAGTDWTNEFSPESIENLNQRSDLRYYTKFQNIGAWGPIVSDTKKFFSDVFLPGMRFTSDPLKDKTASAILGGSTFWIWDPKHPDYGIWALAVSDNVRLAAATKAQMHAVDGWYSQIATKLPTYQQMRDSGLAWQSGWFEAYLETHPSEDPLRKMKKPTAPTIAVTTYELVGMVNGGIVPLSDILKHVGGSDYELYGSLAVADDPSDGFGLSGNPGKWAEYYGAQSPTTYGLDTDKAVMFWDGQRGQVIPGNVLRDLFGPGWRGTIYQST